VDGNNATEHGRLVVNGITNLNYDRVTHPLYQYIIP
jgi:hypothetical protein